MKTLRHNRNIKFQNIRKIYWLLNSPDIYSGQNKWEMIKYFFLILCLVFPTIFLGNVKAEKEGHDLDENFPHKLT